MEGLRVGWLAEDREQKGMRTEGRSRRTVKASTKYKVKASTAEEENEERTEKEESQYGRDFTCCLLLVPCRCFVNRCPPTVRSRQGRRIIIQEERI